MSTHNFDDITYHLDPESQETHTPSQFQPEPAGHQEGVAVHGGFPNPGTDAHRKSLDLNRMLIQHSASTFLMRISGNEWWQEGIFHNDVAVIDRALDPRPGDRVVWWNDGMFAISEYTATPKRAAIWGVVTSIIHQLRKQRLAGEIPAGNNQ